MNLTVKPGTFDAKSFATYFPPIPKIRVLSLDLNQIRECCRDHEIMHAIVFPLGGN